MTRPRQRLRPGIVDLPFRAETIRVVNRHYLHSTYGMPRYFRPSAAGSGPLPDFRNRDIRRFIYPIAPDDRFELRRHSAAISRPVKNSGSGGLRRTESTGSTSFATVSAEKAARSDQPRQSRCMATTKL